MLEVTAAGALQGGAVGLLAVVVLLILRGHLVPRQVHEDRIADLQAHLAAVTAERDAWRDAHTVSEAGRQLMADQNGELLEVARTSGHVLQSLPQPTRQGVRPTDDPSLLDQTPALPAP